jgi:hypothetical protein
VYDVARKETFDSLSMWLQEVEQFSMGGGKEVVKLLVGNKIDQERVVSREVSTAVPRSDHGWCWSLISHSIMTSLTQIADDWAKSRGMLFMEASAKTKEGIAQVFNEVVQKVSTVMLVLPSAPLHCSHFVRMRVILRLQVLENPTLLSNTRPAKPGSRSLGSSANTSSKGACC